MRTGWAEVAAAAIVLAFVVVVAILPAASLFGRALSASGAAGWAAVLANPLDRAAIGNSLLQGSLSAVASILIGFPTGVLLGRYDWRGRDAALGVLLVPFLLPTLVMVTGVESLVGPAGLVTSFLPSAAWWGSGVPGIVFVNVAYNAPLVALFTVVGVERASTALEETVASLGGGAGARFRRVWGPPALTGAAAGGSLAFLFSALAFAAPLVVCGARCYTTEARVWTLAQVLGQPTNAALLGLTMTVLMAAPAIAFLLIAARLRRSGRAEAPSIRPSPFRSPMGSVLAIVAGGFLLTELALVGSVLWRSIAPRGGLTVSLTPWTGLGDAHTSAVLGLSVGGAAVNSLAFGFAAASLALLFGILTTFVVRRRPGLARPVQAAVFVPLVISPILLAFGLASFWRPVLGDPSTVWILILVSQTMIALPFALQSLWLSAAQVAAGPREAAMALGSSPIVAFLDADLPQIRAGLVVAALFAFAVSLGEFTATYFLATPSTTTLPVALYHLTALRQLAPASAVAALLVLLSVAVFVTIATGGRRVEF